MIGIACHARNHGIDTPDEMFKFIHKLDYEYIDVISDILSAEKVVEDPEGSLEFIRGLLDKYELKPSEYLAGASLSAGGKGYHPAELEDNMKDEAYAYFDKVCAFTKKAGFTSLLLSAGDTIPEYGYERTVERAVPVMQKLTQIAKDNGIAYNIEPSMHSEMFNTPYKAKEMAQRVPGLTYTLDLLHYQVQGYGTDECLRLLLPHTNHVHARQAATDWVKCPIEFGEIDYDLMVKRMRGKKWDGVIAIELWTGPKMKMSAVDQGILMRYELKKAIRKYWNE